MTGHPERSGGGATLYREELEAWAASGAMDLTSRPDGPPLGPPEGFVARLRAIGDRLARSSAALGRPVDVDVLALLGERAAIAGLSRGGDVSCGGSARLLPTGDGWLAVNLPRPDDLDLLPAWLAGLRFDAPPGAAQDGEPERFTHRNGTQSARALAPKALSAPELWMALASAVATAQAEPLAGRARLLGLPVAALPRHPGPLPLAVGPLTDLPVIAADLGAAATGAKPCRDLDGVLVVDLSSLWAGPLCTHLLQRAGARVVKVESLHRPDGARYGPAAFVDLLHAGQEAVAFDFREAAARAALRRLLEAADVVVEGSRPRALEQLGIVAEELLTEAGRSGAGPRVWVSITGYGRAAPGRDWVAFGDDAAVAGGLVAWDEAGPCFLADAVADPCSGLVAAAATLAALAAGGHWLLDVPMRDVAAHLAGPAPRHCARPPAGLAAEPPMARTASRRAPDLGEHTAAILAEFGCS